MGQAPSTTQRGPWRAVPRRGAAQLPRGLGRRDAQRAVGGAEDGGGVEISLTAKGHYRYI